MNRGLLRKAIYEIKGITLLCGVGLLLFEILFSFIIQTFSRQFTEQLSAFLEMEFFQNILRSFLGSDIGSQMSPKAIEAMGWVHPVVLVLLWTHAINLCTRVPANEVDRGTVDVLLSMPVSRWCIYRSETVVWMCSGIVVIAMGAVGFLFGNWVVSAQGDVSPTKLLIVLANLYCLYLTVGALALFVSAMSDRRGRAVAVAFGVVLASFFLNFLAQFWQPAKTVSFLSVLNYYEPLQVLQGGPWPMGHMIVLIVCAVTMWIAGGIVFARRDICTV